MFKKSNKRKKEEIDNEEEIEVVIGDDSVLNISEVNDCMNQLRPKDSVNNRKKFIIPSVKKKQNKEKNKKKDENITNLKNKK
jgi:hypothetical protein